MKNSLSLQEKESLATFAGIVHSLTLLSQGELEDGSISEDMVFHVPSYIEDNQLLSGLAIQILTAYQEEDLDPSMSLRGFVERYMVELLKN